MFYFHAIILSIFALLRLDDAPCMTKFDNYMTDITDI